MRIFVTRAKRVEEQIAVCRRLWTEEHVTYQGVWHRISDAGLVPDAGSAADTGVDRRQSPTLRCAALPAWPTAGRSLPPTSRATETRAKFECFYAAVQEVGRDPATLGIEATVVAGDGGPEDWAAAARTWTDLGATQIVFRRARPADRYPAGHAPVRAGHENDVAVEKRSTCISSTIPSPDLGFSSLLLSRTAANTSDNASNSGSRQSLVGVCVIDSGVSGMFAEPIDI